MTTNTSNKHYSAPRRDVSKNRRQLEVDFDSAPVVTTGLYTATSKETLIRTLIQLDVLPPLDRSACTHAIELIIEREGSSIDSVIDTGNITGVVPPTESLWMGQGAVRSAGADEGQHIKEYNIDLKSMRKLTPGDAIKIRGVTDSVSMSKLAGVITFFFKEK